MYDNVHSEGVSMTTLPSHFQELLEIGGDDTVYRRLTADHVSVKSFEGQELLCVAPEALTLLSAQAFHDINFFLRDRT